MSLESHSRAQVHVFLSEENSAAGLDSIIHWPKTPGSRERLGLVCQQPMQWAKPPAQLLMGVLKVGIREMQGRAPRNYHWIEHSGCGWNT